jgi:hypothetical protein
MWDLVDWSIYDDNGQINGHFGQIKHFNGQIIIEIGQIIKLSIALGYVMKCCHLMVKRFFCS